MKNKSIINKLSVGVVISLIALVFSPNINANINKIVVDQEFVEVTTELYGIDGTIPHKIKLTKEKSIEVKELIDDLKGKLYRVKTNEEAIDVFKETISKMKSYGLLPNGMTIEEAQKFISRLHRPNTISNPLWFLFTRNLFCLVAGNASNIHFLTPYPSVKIISTIVQLGSVECGGYCIHHLPASGWVWSVGLLGIKHWDGDFYGAFLFPLNPLYIDGMIGFFGITLNYNNDYTYFIGSTLYLRIINWYE